MGLVGGGGGRGLLARLGLEAGLEQHDDDAHVVAAAQLQAVVDERLTHGAQVPPAATEKRGGGEARGPGTRAPTAASGSNRGRAHSRGGGGGSASGSSSPGGGGGLGGRPF